MIRTGVSVLGWVLLVTGALASLVLLVLRARWKLLGAVVLVAAMAVFAWPLRPVGERSDEPIAVGSTLTVLSLNLQYGGADIDEVVALISPDVDVLALQEYTPDFEGQLAAAGLLEQFPHQAGTSAADASGTMLLSRTPVELVAHAENTAFENLIETTTVDGTDWHLGVIHTAPPQFGAESWARDGAAVRDLAAPHLEENLLLVGDFNAIDQHITMRELTADGDLRDLAARRQGGGTGWHPTWSTEARLPPFARIDHALVSDGVLGGVPEYTTVTGTDHRALLVEVAAVL